MPEQSTTCTARNISTRVQICFSDELPPGCPEFELPDGRMLLEIELPALTLLIIRPGSMDRGLYDAFNRYFARVTHQGNWLRNPARASLLSVLQDANSR